MSRRYPTLEENIRFIVRNLGAERLLREIAAMMEEDPELARRLSRDLLAMSERVEKLLREAEEQKRKQTNGRRRGRKQGR